MKLLLGSVFAALLAVVGLTAAMSQATISARYATVHSRVGVSKSTPGIVVASRSGAPAVYGWRYSE